MKKYVLRIQQFSLYVNHDIFRKLHCSKFPRDENNLPDFMGPLSSEWKESPLRSAHIEHFLKRKNIELNNSLQKFHIQIRKIMIQYKFGNIL